MCQYNKFEFCKFWENCRNQHINDICERTSCDIKSCIQRHPKECKFYIDYQRCKYCSAYSEVRNKVLQEMANICELANNGVNFQEIQSDPLTLTQFILDCTSFNLTKRINYNDNMTSDIFTLSRHLCCHILKTRSRKLKSLELKW